MSVNIYLQSTSPILCINIILQGLYLTIFAIDAVYTRVQISPPWKINAGRLSMSNIGRGEGRREISFILYDWGQRSLCVFKIRLKKVGREILVCNS